ncbi:melatonin receptor type 1B-A-like [Actinia tenebrosa]|uniref:Melatonin receptor type 1B-A-like n=1 Tax=Actinia tenebrosa TaxID=6105 RepID=A0A6P8HGE5_ACTTE|nr:melatonin receptor type 1B-A-like [Actinia tenebrosa]
MANTTNNRENNSDLSAQLEKMFAQELLERGMAEVILEAGALIAIGLTAFFGNSLICLAMYRNKALRRRVTNVFILSLAISDILMACLCIPIAAGVLIEGRWIYSSFGCQFQAYWIYVLAGISLYTMAVTAVNRFYRVVKPRVYNRYFSMRSTLVMILFVWLSIGITIAFLIKINWLRVKFQSAKASCVMYAWLGTKSLTFIYQIVAFLVFFIIPTVLITRCYKKVFRKVREHQRNVTKSLLGARHAARKQNETSTTPFTRTNIEEIDITRTLFRVVLAFAVCWTPVIVYEVIVITSNIFHFYEYLPRQVHLIWLYFGTIGSAVNAFIYGGMNRSFRNEFLKIFNFKNNTRVGVYGTEMSVLTATNAAYKPTTQKRWSAAIQTVPKSPQN